MRVLLRINTKPDLIFVLHILECGIISLMYSGNKKLKGRYW